MKISVDRRKKLKANIKIIFWAKAIMSISVMNIVATLFYLHRGLSLPDLFYLSIVFSVTNLLVEIPSSYMADEWGRKKTLFIGSIALFFCIALLFFANNIFLFSLSVALFSFYFSCFSGTDEALLYDSKKEIGEEAGTLESLGIYHSAQKFFKIVTPIIGALIAKDLLESQFQIIITIDLIAAATGIFLITKITEPNHYMDVEEKEAGTIYDAWKIIKTNPYLIKIILNKTLLFISIFITWRFHQKFFVDIGVSIIYIGFATSMFHLTSFFTLQKISKIYSHLHDTKKINYLNYLYTVIFIIFLIFLIFYPQKYILLTLYALLMYFETIRVPFFSELFNKKSFSYNRATTLSLANFLKSILDIPLLLISGILIFYNQTFPFYFSFLLAIIVVLFIRLDNKK